MAETNLLSFKKSDPDFLYQMLESKYCQYHNPRFIESDPVSIPHMFTKKEDIEISGFLTAIISWGQRKTIVSNGMRLMRLMGNQPHDFIMNANESDLSRLESFVHRTFNSTDCLYFVASLQNIYRNHGGLQFVFEKGFLMDNSIQSALIYFRKVFFETPYLLRTTKHIANVEANSSAKRLNMFLRWMVRNDKRLVDFGLWDRIPTSALYIPLDVHSGNVARKFGLLTRTQNDWKAVEELTAALRKFDFDDPVKYDYALFGLGIFENVK